jgi:uncharacterized protein YndB with AHSA1/START domain
METELEATPEQVWEAIATGPGVNSWFMGRTEIDPGPEGRVRTALGPYVQESTVTVWEPLKHFGYRGPTRPDGSFLALEWLIEGRDGASTVLRSVGSGFIGSDDWEGEYESLRAGGAFYFHNLVQYLKYFAGRAGIPVSAHRVPAGDPAVAWTALTASLGLEASARTGDPVRATPPGLAPVNGEVDYAARGYLGIRDESALYRFYQGMGGVVTAEHHYFAEGVDRQASERAWQAWLDGLAA